MFCVALFGLLLFVHRLPQLLLSQKTEVPTILWMLFSNAMIQMILSPSLHANVYFTDQIISPQGWIYHRQSRLWLHGWWSPSPRPKHKQVFSRYFVSYDLNYESFIRSCIRGLCCKIINSVRSPEAGIAINLSTMSSEAGFSPYSNQTWFFVQAMCAWGSTASRGHAFRSAIPRTPPTSCLHTNACVNQGGKLWKDFWKICPMCWLCLARFPTVISQSLRILWGQTVFLNCSWVSKHPTVLLKSRDFILIIILCLIWQPSRKLDIETDSMSWNAGTLNLGCNGSSAPTVQASPTMQNVSSRKFSSISGKEIC